MHRYMYLLCKHFNVCNYCEPLVVIYCYEQTTVLCTLYYVPLIFYYIFGYVNVLKVFVIDIYENGPTTSNNIRPGKGI